MTIQRFLIVQVACTFLAVTCVLAILLRRGLSFSVNMKALWDTQIFKSALPFAIVLLLMSVHNRIDGFLLERSGIDGAYEAGLYATAYRLLDAANMVGYLLASFLLPFIARQVSERKRIDDVILTARHLLLLFSIPVAITTFFTAAWIQNTLYYHNDPSAIVILQWCLPALAGYALTQVYGTAMTATGHIVPFCYINLVAVIINISLNLLLIPRMGAKACCVSALISQGLCGLACMFYVHQKTSVPFHFRSVLMYIFIAAMLCGYYLLFNDKVENKWLLISGAAILTLTAAFATRLFSIRRWISIVKKTSTP
jgi:O-antigen/teichoic acid export membrane protein